MNRLRPAAVALALCLAASGGGARAEDSNENAIAAGRATRSLLLDVARAGERLVAVGERGHVLLSDDSGQTWRRGRVPTRATLTAVSFIDARRGWAVGHDAVVLHSADGGEQWTEQYADPEAEQPLLDVLFTDARSGIAVGAYGLVLSTENGGDTWNARTISTEEPHLNAILATRRGTCLMAGEFGGLFREVSGNGEWTPLSSPYGGSFFGALTLVDGSLLVFGLQGHVYRSSDEGESWGPAEARTSAGLMGGVVLSDGRVILVGLSGTLLVGAPDGRRFRLVQRPDRMGIASAVEAPDGSLVLVGNSGVQRMAVPAPALDVAIGDRPQEP